MKSSNQLFHFRRQGTTLTGICGLAFGSVLLLCGAGLTPAGNVLTSDLDASGHAITNAGTVSASVFQGSASGLTNFPGPVWETVATNFTAQAGHRYQIDTVAGPVTATLPGSASANALIEFRDMRLSWGTNAVTLARNGNKINGAAGDYNDTVIGDKLEACATGDANFGWSVK